MLKLLLVVLFLSLGLPQLPGAAGAQTPEATTTQTPEATATLTPEGTATPTATATTQPPSPPVAGTPSDVPQLPVRIISTDASLASTIVEDADENGVSSAGDRPASTLVEIQANAHLVNSESFPDPGPPGVIGLFADKQGSFRFADMPPGNYVLMVWGFGFVGAPTAPTNPGLFQTNIVVSADGKVTGRVPVQFLLKKKPEGVVGYPVRTGGEGGPVPVGTVDVGLALGTSGGVILPGTGDGAGIAGSDLARLVALGLLVAVAVITVAVGQRSLRRR